MADAPETLDQACADAPPVEVVTNNFELQAMLHESLQAAGFQVTTSREPRDDRVRGITAASGPVTTVWDVPVLDASWPLGIENRSRFGPVVALLGFADRAMVAEARSRGASACLDVPFDLADLINVLNRLARSLSSSSVSSRTEPAHPVPPPPSSRSSRGRAAILARETRA
jgi:CheY-like chemotaxis protein